MNIIKLPHHKVYEYKLPRVVYDAAQRGKACLYLSADAESHQKWFEAVGEPIDCEMAAARLNKNTIAALSVNISEPLSQASLNSIALFHQQLGFSILVLDKAFEYNDSLRLARMLKKRLNLETVIVTTEEAA